MGKSGIEKAKRLISQQEAEKILQTWPPLVIDSFPLPNHRLVIDESATTTVDGCVVAGGHIENGDSEARQALIVVSEPSLAVKALCRVTKKEPPAALNAFYL